EPWASDDRLDAIQYNVGWVAIDEWLNYTRTFPAGEYYVYARLAFGGSGPFGAQLDRVTSDRSQPDQTTEKLGTFRSSTATGGWQNYEFIPLIDDDGNLVSLDLSGVDTLRVTAVQGGYNANYYMLVPADVDLPRITNLTVSSGETIDSRDGISFNVESNTGVAREDLRLVLNGEDLTGSAAITGDENEWSVSLSNLEEGASYELEVHALDADGNSQVLFTGQPFTVSFDTLTVIPAYLATPPGSGSEPGFTVRVHNARDDAGLASDIARAEAQLAGELIDPDTGEPYVNLAIGEPGDQGDATFIETGTIAYEQEGNDVGDWATEPFPGIPAGGVDQFAVEVTTYLELEAGTHRVGFRHDDGFRLAAGPSFEEDSIELNMIEDWDQGGPSGETEFLIEEAGVYAIRLLQYEGGGGASLVWYSIDAETGDQILINDTSDARAIRAFQNREGEPSIPEPEDGVPAPSIVWDGNSHVISWEGTGFT
ncbi:MAG: hypothetical protein WD342_05780, partial [Verrucomicrobiales bacterium]